MHAVLRQTTVLRFPESQNTFCLRSAELGSTLGTKQCPVCFDPLRPRVLLSLCCTYIPGTAPCVRLLALPSRPSPWRCDAVAHCRLVSAFESPALALVNRVQVRLRSHSQRYTLCFSRPPPGPEASDCEVAGSSLAAFRLKHSPAGGLRGHSFPHFGNTGSCV